MIKNFEEYTHNLTADEKLYVIPRLFKLLILAIVKKNAIKNKDIAYHCLPSI